MFYPRKIIHVPFSLHFSWQCLLGATWNPSKYPSLHSLEHQKLYDVPTTWEARNFTLSSGTTTTQSSTDTSRPRETVLSISGHPIYSSCMWVIKWLPLRKIYASDKLFTHASNKTSSVQIYLSDIFIFIWYIYIYLICIYIYQIYLSFRCIYDANLI